MIKIKNIAKLIEFLQKDFAVFAPIKDGKATAFGQIQNVDEICNAVLNTKKSPKNVQGIIYRQKNKIIASW